MNKLLTLGGATLLGYAGWWLADAAGLGLFGAFLAGGLGSLAGVWLGWKLARRLE